MAPIRKPRTRTVTVETIDGETARIDEPADLADFLKGIGGDDITVKLYKLDRYNKQYYIDDIPYDQIKTGSVEAMIREDHGGGSFLVRCCKAGKLITGGSKILHIAPDSQTMGYAPPPKDGGNADQIRMMEMQMKMQGDQADRQMQIMQAFNTQLMAIMTAVMTNSKPMDPIALAQLLKSDGGSNLQAVRDLVGLAKELAPVGGKDDDPIMALITSALPSLLAKPGSAPTEALPPKPPVLPAPVVASSTPVAAPAEQKVAPQFVQVQQFLEKLRGKAEAKADPEFWADYIAFNQDEPACAYIAAAIEKFPFDNVWTQLVAKLPGLADHKEWFKSLWDSLQEPEANEPNPEDGAK